VLAPMRGYAQEKENFFSFSVLLLFFIHAKNFLLVVYIFIFNKSKSRFTFFFVYIQVYSNLCIFIMLY
jgi:hypothetical protein